MVAGIGRSRMLAMFALGALAAAGPVVAPDPNHQRRDAPPPPPDPWAERRARQDRAWERRERKRRDAEGKDDRPDKYLHAAARRRRAAEAEASPTPSSTTAEQGA